MDNKDNSIFIYILVAFILLAAFILGYMLVSNTEEDIKEIQNPPTQINTF